MPPELRSLLNELFASDLATADPYIVDLNLSGSPYATAVVLYLRERFNDPLAFSIRAFLELFPATTPEEEEPAYLRFKQRLFGTIHPTFAQFLDPAQPRTIAGREVVWGGVGVDGIPPLESPVFLTPDEAAGWINPSDQIVGVEINGDARAYPVRIIAWHELVNDTVGGVPVSLVYCTLCGSPILYDGRVDGAVYRFGTSGLLYRSNKLMYDRVTNTLWDQFVGEPVWGELVGSGIRVAPLPSVNTTWEQWLAAHPDTTVLDINTGFERDYGPGVAYRDYNASPRLMFPVPTGDSPPPRQGGRRRGPRGGGADGVSGAAPARAQPYPRRDRRSADRRRSDGRRRRRSRLRERRPRLRGCRSRRRAPHQRRWPHLATDGDGAGRG